MIGRGRGGIWLCGDGVAVGKRVLLRSVGGGKRNSVSQCSENVKYLTSSLQLYRILFREPHETDYLYSFLPLAALSSLSSGLAGGGVGGVSALILTMGGGLVCFARGWKRSLPISRKPRSRRQAPYSTWLPSRSHAPRAVDRGRKSHTYLWTLGSFRTLVFLLAGANFKRNRP